MDTTIFGWINNLMNEGTKTRLPTLYKLARQMRGSDVEAVSAMIAIQSGEIPA